MSEMDKIIINRVLEDTNILPRYANGKIRWFQGHLEVSRADVVSSLFSRGWGFSKPQITCAIMSMAAELPPPTDQFDEDEMVPLMDQVKASLVDLGIVTDFDNNRFTRNGVPMPISSLTLEVYDAIQRRYKDYPNKGMITDMLGHIFALHCESRYKEVLGDLVYDPKVEDKFEEFLRLITGTNYKPIYVPVLKQVIWSIKRTLYQLPRWNPIMMVLYGRANGGKSRALEALLKPIQPTGKILDEAHVDALINDERKQEPLTSAVVIILNELGDIKKANSDILKNLIDREKVTYRILGSNTHLTGNNVANLIGSSNKRIRDVIIAENDVRKWCEIDFAPTEDQTEIMEKIVGPVTRFDVVSLYKCIDENGPAPFSDAAVYQEFRQWTAGKCMTRTKTVQFLVNICKQWVGHNKTWGGEEIYNEYKAFVAATGDSKPKANNTFVDALTNWGFKRHRTSDGVTWTSPEKFLYHMDEFEGMTIGTGESTDTTNTKPTDDFVFGPSVEAFLNEP